MTLAGTIADDLRDVLLSDFGETVVYFPRGGMARAITAALTRMADLATDEQGTRLVETARLLVRRDAAAGIAEPQLGDAVRLPGDGEDARWDFSGVVSRDSASLVVEFRRTTLQRVRPRK